MADTDAGPVRVLLLARPGEARARLERALADAGADLLLAIDPAEGDVEAIAGLRPGAVLVALEPAVEEALERYDALLSDPGVLVMFDEADVAARRDGWDAARWVRHLAAKLNGHQDVLPPGAESDDVVHPRPGALPDRDFDAASVDFGALNETAMDLAAEVPRADSFEPSADTGATFEGLVTAEDMDWSSSSGTYGDSQGVNPDLEALLASVGTDIGAMPVDDGGQDPIAAMSIEGVRDAPDADAEADADADTAPGPVDPLSLGDGLSLADDDAPLATREAGKALDLDALTSRLDALSLADPESYGQGVLRGAVVVEAGLGGPDAVRQLIGGLGQGFPRAVLVRLQLDGGRYDRLVQQMQRATPLPVALAEAGAAADPGTVYFLSPDITVAVENSRIVFAPASPEAQDGGYGALPATDTALVFLSGASTDRVDGALARSADGVLVLAQAPDSCYDGAAVSALAAGGAATAAPGDLAQVLLDRWPS